MKIIEVKDKIYLDGDILIWEDSRHALNEDSLAEVVDWWNSAKPDESALRCRLAQSVTESQRNIERDRRRCAYYLESFRDLLHNISQHVLAHEAENIRNRILDGSAPSTFYKDEE